MIEHLILVPHTQVQAQVCRAAVNTTHLSLHLWQSWQQISDTHKTISILQRPTLTQLQSNLVVIAIFQINKNNHPPTRKCSDPWNFCDVIKVIQVLKVIQSIFGRQILRVFPVFEDSVAFYDTKMNSIRLKMHYLFLKRNFP